jgi:hypothetical protein
MTIDNLPWTIEATPFIEKDGTPLFSVMSNESRVIRYMTAATLVKKLAETAPNTAGQPKDDTQQFDLILKLDNGARYIHCVGTKQECAHNVISCVGREYIFNGVCVGKVVSYECLPRYVQPATKSPEDKPKIFDLYLATDRQSIRHFTGPNKDCSKIAAVWFGSPHFGSFMRDIVSACAIVPRGSTNPFPDKELIIQ